MFKQMIAASALAIATLTACGTSGPTPYQPQTADSSRGYSEQRIENDRGEAETERLKLALQLLQNGDTAAVGLYQRLFPLPQVVNQIDHAAVNAPANGQASLSPASER